MRFFHPLLFSASTLAVGPASLGSDVEILLHNDLLEAESPLANSGVILLEDKTLQEGIHACEALGESLWGRPPSTPADIKADLEYLLYRGDYDRQRSFWISPTNNTARTISLNGTIATADATHRFPVLCTQNAPYSTETYQNTSSPYQVTVHANNEYLTGFRDHVTFRFIGIRFATEQKRWTYPVAYTGSGGNISVLEYGSNCHRDIHGNEENCLILNIWTPYLPSLPTEKNKLRPVAFWIHGGAFTGGSPNDAYYDGGNLASRGDVVVIGISYRLGTQGFLALNDGKTNGNFGLADQIAALDWVRQNVEVFGGNPDRITIFGQSAGAASVRAMLASPKAKGKFASAIMQSNLGGLAYGTTYSQYYTIEEEMQIAGNSILEETSCTVASSPVDCLRNFTASAITALNTTARYLVVDGTYLTSPGLDLSRSTEVPHVPVMMGIMRDDGAQFIDYPSAGENISAFLTENDLPSSVLSTGLFPLATGPNTTLDVFNTSARVATDSMFRCIDEATGYAGVTNDIFPEVYFYEFNRSYELASQSPNGRVCYAPPTAEYPHGDPSLEYWKCHSGDLYYMFGNLRRLDQPFRDEYELPFEQYVLDSWASFIRTGNPTPDLALLKARGYVNASQVVQESGAWRPLKQGDYSLRRFQWPPYQAPFDETEQCTALNLSLGYYV
ncbi:cholinesterase [Aspergillus sclerotioniger CBS 115572]|uniref:Carboxylic ester hydrolase n=1 Tax=Aspergillus sclerotioniger CBS 115572 TaxID=1450535 RepID=A0A317WZ87_9EURO|nr:cholinesterase [Aspergillus sclerotioniger CBS 115572]PWY90577.1 cholinesterase [Aspergillus sclerotioniger CBS 115572]